MKSVSIKPLMKKIFFLDLKDFPNKKKLIKDLEFLGAKEEICLDKNVSFVVSDKVPVKSEFKIPLTRDTSSKSSHLFKDSPFSNLNSPVSWSPMFIESPMPITRTQSLLLKAKRKTKMGTKNVTEICHQWNIKIYPLQKVLSWIEKYKCKYYKSHSDKKKHRLQSENVQKIVPPFLKFEDAKRNYKPKYKSFNSWTSVIDSHILQSVNKIVKSFNISGDVSDPPRLVLKEISNKPVTINSPLCSRNASIRNEITSVSRVPIYTSISNSLLTCGSKVLKKENPQNKKAKKNEQIEKSNRHYCDICGVHFTDDDHYQKKSHMQFIDNASNYKQVQGIISSLMQPEDFLASLKEL